MEYYQIELPNGIRCVHRPVRSSVAYCGLTINTGSRDELPGEHGIAHFTEHSLFKGTLHRKAYQINSRLENLGGELNAFTTKEETVVHATTLRGDFAKAAELIADVAFHSTFPQKEIEREKEIVYDEINSYKDSPSERIYDDFEDLMFSGSSLGHNILGSKKSVAEYTAANVAAFRNRAYNTDQMVFSSIGPFGEKRFLDICHRYFGSLPENRRAFRREPISPAPFFSQERRRGTFQAHCVIGSRAYSNTDPKRIPFSVLVNLLGGMSSNSLLNVALREKNGFTYCIEASFTPFSDTGVSSIYFGTEKDRVERCFELIKNELLRIREGRISARQFSMAKKQFTGQLRISLESNENNMLSAGKSVLVYGHVDETAELLQRIQAVTLSDLVEIAHEIYDTPQSSLIYR